MGKIELEYVHVEKEVQWTPFEFPIVSDVTEYTNANIRNRVIVKFDLIYGMQRIFGKELKEDDRDLAFGLVSGLFQEPTEVSTVILYFYKEYKVFHNYLSEIFLFDERIENTPISVLLMQNMIAEYRTQYNNLEECMRSQHCKIILESNGYAYIAVPDSDVVLRIPGDYNEEVLSNAKVWNYKYTRV